jgi:hypothetical protein
MSMERPGFQLYLTVTVDVAVRPYSSRAMKV